MLVQTASTISRITHGDDMTAPEHVIVKWNATDAFAQETISAHAKLLMKHSSAWWGKISKTGRLGIGSDDVQRLQAQIQSGQHVHLYLYCPDVLSGPPTLHVALVDVVQEEPPSDWDLIPSYYSQITYPKPFWFRLSDIRALTPERYGTPMEGHMRRRENPPHWAAELRAINE
jgi:hypothetical protein